MGRLEGTGSGDSIGAMVSAALSGLPRGGRRGYRPAVSAARPDGAAFSFQRRSDGTVIISYHDAPVAALRGATAERFIARVEAKDEPAAQALMARATGAAPARRRPRA